MPRSYLDLNRCGLKALRLKIADKIRLVEAILSSLHQPDPEIEKAWVAESEARYAVYLRGEVEVIDWEIIRERYEPTNKNIRKPWIAEVRNWMKAVNQGTARLLDFDERYPDD
ncbi:MAG: addiction module protein [Desulfatirhabdiaceae bacterium]